MRATLVSLVLATAAWAAPESGLFCPLGVPSTGLVGTTPEALQKRFASVALDKSGYALSLRKEVEGAIATAKVSDYATSNDALAKVAVAAKVQHAGYVALSLEGGAVSLQGRIVGADGKLEKAANISVPRGTEPLLDVVTSAAEKFFDQLNGLAPPAPVADVRPEAPPLVMAPPEERANPGTPLRIAGVVLGGVGVATLATGVGLIVTAGTVQQDASGNVAIGDADRVPGIRSQQSAALGVLTAGGALAITGVLMFALAPNAPVTAAVAPSADGAMFAVGGKF